MSMRENCRFVGKIEKKRLLRTPPSRHMEPYGLDMGIDYSENIIWIRSFECTSNLKKHYGKSRYIQKYLKNEIKCKNYKSCKILKLIRTHFFK